jgi:hypothetical protein
VTKNYNEILLRAVFLLAFPIRQDPASFAGPFPLSLSNRIHRNLLIQSTQFPRRQNETLKMVGGSYSKMSVSAY